MNSGLRWKLIVAFLLVFFAGLACGFFGALHSARWMIGHHRGGSVAEHMKQRLQWQLKLTDEQMKQISPIIDRTASQLEAKRQQTTRDVHQIFQQGHRDIAPFLTPEQRERLRDMAHRHERLLRRHGFAAPDSTSPTTSAGNREQ